MDKSITTRVDKKTIKDMVKKILADRLGLKIDGIKSTALLKDDLGIDSFDALRIIFEVENEFDIKVPPTEAINIKTVNDAVNYIVKRLNGIS